MKKIILVLGVLCMMVGFACASTDCSSYFSNADDKRLRVTSDATALSLTSDREQRSIQNLYNDIDNLHSNENLSTLSDDLNDMVNKKNDANDDIRSIVDDTNSYDNAISDARKNLPNACFNRYSLYDRDIQNVRDWFRDVKRNWDKFTPRFDEVANYRNHLSTTNASYARPKVDDLQGYIDDVSSSVGNGITFGINTTSSGVNATYYNQTECFGMITKNVDIATKDCVTKCNAALNRAAQNCTSQAPDCTGAIAGVQQSLNICQAKLSTQANCPVCPICPAAVDTSAKDAQISTLNMQLNQVNSNLDAANVNIKGLTDKYTNATAQLAKAGVCESCLVYKIIALLLFLLIVAAWIIKM